jgi:hypothetical protein
MQNAAQLAFANQTEAKKRRNKKKSPDFRTARRENPALKKIRISDLGSKRPQIHPPPLLPSLHDPSAGAPV